VNSSRKSRVPSGRLSRFLQLGATASKIALGGAKEASSRLLGRSQEDHNVFFTLENATALADRLSRLRGAAMKLGQMISLEGDNLLPKPFVDALAVLRDNADTMPESQVREVLNTEYGKDWEEKFSSFDFAPIASASIGQVHRATAKDGRRVALKLQYPGVASSIDSDVDNLSALLNLSRVLPTQLDFAEIVRELKAQLREEVDYLRELSQLQAYTALLAGDPRIRTPLGYADLSTGAILAMEFIYAKPLALWAENATQAERDRVGALLVELLLKELFEFGLVQTDPNFSNFFYDPHQEQLVLLDFGATRQLPSELREAYRRIVSALVSGNFNEMHDALMCAGFFTEAVPEHVRHLITQATCLGHEIFREPGPYDFATSELIAKLREQAPAITRVKPYLTSPPAQLLFFQRKVAGMYLMCRKLRCRVDCRTLAEKYAR
jgi:predicted unusual protein kinase regulating ubiquinone biosynthesis (AarF/ABC1/UbiB family)